MRDGEHADPVNKSMKRDRRRRNWEGGGGETLRDIVMELDCSGWEEIRENGFARDLHPGRYISISWDYVSFRMVDLISVSA